MSPAAVVTYRSTKDAALTPFIEPVARYAQASRAESTLRGYRTDWRQFEEWCEANGLVSLPATAATVAAYISTKADQRDLKVGTIQRHVAAIRAFHGVDGYESPTASMEVKLTLAGIRRTLGVAQDGKAPVLTTDVASMISRIPDKLLGVRDRALLLVGFAGAFRRSELVALNFEDVEFREDGLKVTIRRSKTDQEGAGQVIGIACGTALCPVRALRDWLSAGNITAGPIFRNIDRHGRILSRMTAQSVALVVKRYAEDAGLDPANYAGHSLRSGFCTQAAINGVPEHAIMKQTRHKSSQTLRKYLRDANLFRANASARVGL